MSLPSELAIGTAGEHIVCADLLMNGHRAFLANQACPYDVAVEVEGRMVRIQVKATRQQRSIPQRETHIASYLFHVRRCGKGGKRLYQVNDFDMLALVALDINRIAYMPPSQFKTTIHMRPPGTPTGKQFDDYKFDRAMNEVIHGS